MNQVTRNILVVAVLVVVGFLAYSLLTMPDHRSAGQKIGDAVNELPNGVDKAGRQLESRTPGQKIGDTIKDNTDAK